MPNKILSAIMGLCVGDALGVPVEFNSREKLKQDPVVDMRSYGTYNQPTGTWSDDSSMTLCTLDSLSSGLDYKDIMDKFLSWYKKGEYTPFGETFDIGMGTSRALTKYANGEEPLKSGGIGERDNGNGSLMRIFPVLFYLQKTYGENWIENEESYQIIHNISALTHRHRRSMIACGIYITIADYISKEYNLKKAVDLGIKKSFQYYEKKEEFKKELKHYERLQDKKFHKILEDEIKSSGYVVESLEASLWCLLNTETYKDCVLKAVNLGEDTDTIAAIAGGLAGVCYGYHDIPKEWIDIIQRRGFIEKLCRNFYKNIKGKTMKKLKGIISNIKKEYINFQYNKKRDIEYLESTIKQIKKFAVVEDIKEEEKLDLLENLINKIKESNETYNNKANLEYISDKILEIKEKFEKTWETEHIPKAEKINKAIDRGISTPVLTVCGKGTREIRFTKYLAYYLDSNNLHGLGEDFLRSTIDPIIKNKYENLKLDYKSKIKVIPEAYIGKYTSEIGLEIGCTCDIVIESANFAIFIEQKLLSSEDYNNAADIRQLERYTRVINENSKYKNRRKIKIFLTPKGKESKRSNDWISISHMDLIGNSIKYLSVSNLNNTSKENLKSLLIDLVIGPYEDSSDLLYQIKDSTSKLLSKNIKIQDILTFKKLVKENGELIKIITEG